MTTVRFNYNARVTLGAHTAENDKILADEFVPIETVGEVDNEQNAIILGRKGSGKSALRIHFEKKDTNALRSASLAPETDELDIVFKYLLKNEAADFAIEPLIRIWKLSIMIALLRKVHEHSSSDRKKRVLNGLPKTFCKEILEIRGLISPSKCIKILERLAKRRVSIDRIENLLSEKINYFAELDNITYVALIDSVDEALHNDADTSNRGDLFATYFESLISAFHQIVNKERSVFNGHVVVKVFLPLDIYEWASDRHDDRLRQHKHYIVWRRKQLRDFMVRRLFHNLTKTQKQKVLQVTDHEERASTIWSAFLPESIKITSQRSRFGGIDVYTKTFTYLISHTLERPRDLQELMENIEEVRIAEGENFPTEHVINEALKTNSNALEESVRREYGNVFPEIDLVLARLGGGNAILSRNQLESIIQEVCGRDNLKVNRAIKILYEACVIGACKNCKDDTRPADAHHQATYYYEFRNFNSIRHSERFVVHRAFWHALMINTW